MDLSRVWNLVSWFTVQLDLYFKINSGLSLCFLSRWKIFCVVFVVIILFNTGSVFSPKFLSFPLDAVFIFHGASNEFHLRRCNYGFSLGFYCTGFIVMKGILKQWTCNISLNSYIYEFVLFKYVITISIPTFILLHVSLFLLHAVMNIPVKYWLE